MLIGYVRISSQEQQTARQDALMKDLGAQKVFVDVASGSSGTRPGLRDLLAFVREGDTVVVESISRIARNTRDLLNIIDTLAGKNVEFVSRKEAIDTKTPAGKFMLTVFGAVAELERDYLLVRQREGIEQAKLQGKYRGRRPIDVDPALWEAVCSKWRAGEISAVEAQRRLGLSASSFYRRVRNGSS